uniref:Uncharacterized protein n=1 Tax=Oryza barthii TaxID=65489 RepID=A0A0D3H9L0_9ORYZ
MAAAAAANDTTPAKAAGPQLKLLVDKRSRRVLYAEARKDAVDFLIGLLRRYYRCNAYAMPCRSNPLNVTDTAALACPGCRQPMTVEMKWAAGGGSKPAEEEEAAAGGEGGYVKEVVTYLVMDDLSIEPMSTISAVMLLKKFDVKDCSALDEMTVDLGPKECVKLLKASLESTTALTDVFGGGVSIDRLE